MDVAARKRVKQSSALLSLPQKPFSHVLSFLSFEKIANIRIVCHRFNVEGRRMLNGEAARISNQWHECMLRLKFKLLPRRLTEREKHPLFERWENLKNARALFQDLLDTYAGHLDGARCCFVFGKVLDVANGLVRMKEQHEKPNHRFYNLIRELTESIDEAKDFYDGFVLDTSFYGSEASSFDEDFLPAVDLDHHTYRRLNSDALMLRQAGIFDFDPFRRWKKNPRPKAVKKFRGLSVGRQLRGLVRKIRKLRKSKERIRRMNRGLKSRNTAMALRVKKEDEEPPDSPEWMDYFSDPGSDFEDSEESEEDYMRCFDDADNYYKWWDPDSDYGVGYFYNGYNPL